MHPTGDFQGGRICVRLTHVAIATKIFAFYHKILASVVQGRVTVRLGVATHASILTFDVLTQLEDENSWYCTSCTRQQRGTIKKLTLSSLPDILVVHLKRFRQVTYNDYNDNKCRHNMRPSAVTVAQSGERVCNLLVATTMATLIAVEVFDVR